MFVVQISFSHYKRFISFLHCNIASVHSKFWRSNFKFYFFKSKSWQGIKVAFSMHITSLAMLANILEKCEDKMIRAATTFFCTENIFWHEVFSRNLCIGFSNKLLLLFVIVTQIVLLYKVDNFILNFNSF